MAFLFSARKKRELFLHLMVVHIYFSSSSDNLSHEKKLFMKVKKKNHVFFSHHCEIYQFCLSRSKLKLHSKTKKTKIERSERVREREKLAREIFSKDRKFYFYGVLFFSHTPQYITSDDGDENTLLTHTSAA
jgi:hypothetical protein